MSKFRRYVHQFIWIGLWLLLPSPILAEETFTFDDILKMLDHSQKPLNYLGTKFVIDYTPSRRSTTLVKVTYGASGWEKREVSPLQQGESQIILDDGKFLWHYIPSQSSVIKKKRQFSMAELSRRLQQQKELIQKNYTITIETQPQVRRIQSAPSVIGDIMVALHPKTGDRPSWKIWIDREHGLVVRTEVYDIQGELALLSAFSELTFRPQIPQKNFVITVPQGTQLRTSVEQNFSSITDAQSQVSFPLAAPAYLPLGFVPLAVIVIKTGAIEKVQMTYIDGMSSISIFQEKQMPPSTTDAKRSQEVAINSSIKGTFHDEGLLKVLRWPLDSIRYVTLVGEVADSELLKIASSITP